MAPTYKLRHPDARGRGEPMRIMLVCCGKLEELDDVRYPIDPSKFSDGIEAAIPEFGVARAAGLHDANMGRIPVMEVEGVTIGNTAPIERLVAKRLGMQGKNDIEAALIDQCCENIADISAAYQKDKGDDAAAWLKTKLSEWAGKLEKSVGATSGFAVGEGTTTQADVRVYYFVKEYFDAKEAAAAGFAACPKLLAIANRIAAIPAVVAYLAERKITPF
ncbi:hypothetical protein T484DRAFT_1851413 [Baffinella frigidus]|nr:hypothetical protein T484DRAFT_1851413 [Cryptophyta sp. CCMP2293]